MAIRLLKWNASEYDEKHSFVWKYGQDLVEMLAPRSGERILDIGCGTGHLTSMIAKSGANVVGIDNSQDMIDQARKNFPSLEFELAGVEDFTFPYSFDAAFSNAALHWVRSPRNAVRSISKSLKPGGRFVAEFGGKGNVSMVLSALRQSLNRYGDRISNLWYFPSIAEFSKLLEEEGFVTTFAQLFDRPAELEGGENGLESWLRTFVAGLMAELPPKESTQVIREVEERLRSTSFRNGAWVVDYVRIRVAAKKLDQK